MFVTKKYQHAELSFTFIKIQINESFAITIAETGIYLLYASSDLSKHFSTDGRQVSLLTLMITN